MKYGWMNGLRRIISWFDYRIFCVKRFVVLASIPSTDMPVKGSKSKSVKSGRGKSSQLYHCSICQKNIGHKSEIFAVDQLNQVFCSLKCQMLKTVSRLPGRDLPSQRYHCYYCRKYIGKRSLIYSIDKFDRVFCSLDCKYKSYIHPSYELEALGRDY